MSEWRQKKEKVLNILTESSLCFMLHTSLFIHLRIFFLFKGIIPSCFFKDIMCTERKKKENEYGGEYFIPA